MNKREAKALEMLKHKYSDHADLDLLRTTSEFRMLMEMSRWTAEQCSARVVDLKYNTAWNEHVQAMIINAGTEKA